MLTITWKTYYSKLRESLCRIQIVACAANYRADVSHVINDEHYVSKDV